MRFAWVFVLLLAGAPVHADTNAPAFSKKLPLRGWMVLNESGFGDATLLVDEQELVGDPAAGQGAKPVNGWHADWTAWHYPASAVIDLGGPHRLTAIYFYDGEGTGSLTVEGGEPFKWKPLAADTLGRYQEWVGQPVDVETRYVRVTLGDPGTKMPELVLYGEALACPERDPDPVAHVQPTMDRFIGINAFIDDPLDKMLVGGVVREFHSWQWNEGDTGDGYPGYPKNENRFQPAAGGGGAWFFDDYYARFVSNGVTAFPAIQGTVRWMFDKPEEFQFDWKPVRAGRDPLDPASYVEHADHLFQYAARYGGTVVDDALLKLAPDQPRRSGLGLLTYIENWNEQDKTWRERAGYFSAYAYAAMASADYDGHRGAMGKTVGVKNADPGMKLVMGGIAGLKLDYIRAIKFWSDHHRGGEVPFDVINLHHYANTGGEQRTGQVGISPEADRFAERLRPFVEYRNRHMPGKEIWVTEFGYDTHPASPQRAPAIGAKSQEQVQADWLLRTYFALAEAGVDRACMYMLRDVDPASATQFDTSGLVGPKGSWAPKPSWFYVYTLRSRLAGMRFAGAVASEREDVRVYRFQHVSETRMAYAVWCPTSEGRVVKGFSLTVPDDATASVVKFANGEKSGREEPLAIAGGAVTIEVSETPVMVMVESK